MTRTLRFDVNSVRTHDALALIYDLEGFSRFVNQPDVKAYVPRYLNHISRAVSVVIHGGTPYWLPIEDVEYDALRKPAHEKFLGDGALYIWTFTKKEPRTLGFARELCNRLRHLARNFARVEQDAYDRMPVVERPKHIRFGVAVGDVLEFRRNDVERAPHEFAGVCINLASRLQSYCPNVTLLASARIGLTADNLERHGYVRVIAKKIKGFPREAVVLDKVEYEGLTVQTRERHFDTE